MDSIQNGYLMRYLEQNTLFARTVVVKLKEAAELINEGVVVKNGLGSVDVYDPTTWKYYQNLAGQYHFTDTMMSVVSIDTLEIIDFTVENLRIHTATAKAHAYGSRHYYSLVYRYPDQEMLINGILSPVNIDDAIAAENGTILGYQPDLVERNETSLVAELEDYLKKTIHRWYNVQFAMSDNLFVATFFTTLHLFILPKLLNLRLKRCKTAEAHSFHVRMYLASHGGLDRYLPYMTLKQALWFYRNICYLERNAGKVSQFTKLVEKLLTDRGIPLAEYSLRQLDDFQANYRPVIAARRKMLNVKQNALTDDLSTLDQLFAKEAPLEEGNQAYLDIKAEDIRFRIETSNSAVMQTKALESSMVDYSNAVPEPFEVVALRQWCYMANAGLYDVMVTFKNPKTTDTYSLTAKDAFLYMQYILLNSEGITLHEMPQYLNMQQRIHPKPTLTDLLSVIPHQEHDLEEIAKEILARQPVIEPCYSVSSFYEQVDKLTNEAYWHWFLISSMQDYYERGLVENMVRRLYEDVRVEFDAASPYVGEWLSINNLPVYDFDRQEALACVKAIYEAGTGLVVDNARLLKNIQAAMIGMMTELSSYSIQITKEINTDDIIPINWPAVRLGNQRQSQEDERTIDVVSLVIDAASHGNESAHIGTTLDTTGVPNNSTSEYALTTLIEMPSMTVGKTLLEISLADVGPSQHMSVTYDGQNAALELEMMLPGYTSFDNLPEDFRMKLKSKYH